MDKHAKKLARESARNDRRCGLRMGITEPDPSLAGVDWTGSPGEYNRGRRAKRYRDNYVQELNGHFRKDRKRLVPSTDNTSRRFTGWMGLGGMMAGGKFLEFGRVDYLEGAE